MLSTATLPFGEGAPENPWESWTDVLTGVRPLLCSTGAHMLDGYSDTNAVPHESRICAAAASATGDELTVAPCSVYALSTGLGDDAFAVSSTGSEIRVGTYSASPTGYRFSSVRITSATPVADIQLAQTLPSGRLLVVFSVYTDSDHEYEAAVIDPSRALVDQFSLPAAEWAQSMPLSRFRLVGSSLYELGTTEQGAFVDRYDLGVS